MMTSMTGFGHAADATSEGHITVEIRSVNHRYLEQNFRLPEELRVIEPSLRKVIRERLARGKVDVFLKITPEAREAKPIELNTTLATHLIKASESIRSIIKHPAPTNPSDILKWPGVITQTSFNTDYLVTQAHVLFDQALEELISSRKKEGQALKQFICAKILEVIEHVKQLQAIFPTLKSQQRLKLEARVAELSASLDPDRLEQELLILAQKSDVSEELDRLHSHCNEIKDIAETKAPMGRRMDFFLQEMNREINTIGSKLSEPTVTPHVVESKVLLEQIREQIQNIE